MGGGQHQGGIQRAPRGILAGGGLRGAGPAQGEGAGSPRPGLRRCTRLRCPGRCCAASKGAQPQNGGTGASLPLRRVQPGHCRLAGGMLLDAGFGAGEGARPMGWAVPMEVTPAVGPHGAGCSCGRCGMRGRFWSRAGVRRGHRREGQNPGPPRVWLGTGSCCRQPSCGSTFICEPVWGGLSQRIWGCSAMGSLHWGEPLALPVGQAPPGDLNAWDQGNGTKQGLDPNGAIPPAQGAAANPKPHPWHTTPVPRLWSHPGVSSHWGPIPAPSLGTGRAQQ